MRQGGHKYKELNDELSITEFESPEKISVERLRNYLSSRGIINQEISCCREELHLLFRKHVLPLPQRKEKTILQSDEVITNYLANGEDLVQDIQVNVNKVNTKRLERRKMARESDDDNGDSKLVGSNLTVKKPESTKSDAGKITKPVKLKRKSYDVLPPKRSDTKDDEQQSVHHSKSEEPVLHSKPEISSSPAKTATTPQGTMHGPTIIRFQQSPHNTQLEKPSNKIREKILKLLGKEDPLLSNSGGDKRKIMLSGQTATNPSDATTHVTGGRQRNEEKVKNGGNNEEVEVVEVNKDVKKKSRVAKDAVRVRSIDETIHVNIGSGKLRSSVVISKNADETEGAPVEQSHSGATDGSKQENKSSKTTESKTTDASQNKRKKSGSKENDDTLKKRSKSEEGKKETSLNTKQTPEKTRRSPEKNKSTRHRESRENEKGDNEHDDNRERKKSPIRHDDNRERKKSPIRRSSRSRSRSRSHSRSPGARNRNTHPDRRFLNIRRNPDRGRRGGRFDYRGGRFGGGYRGGRGGYGGRGRGNAGQFNQFNQFNQRRYNERRNDRPRSPERMRRQENPPKERNRSHSPEKRLKPKGMEKEKKKNQKPSKEEIEKMEEELKKIDLMIEIRKTKKSKEQNKATVEESGKTSKEETSKDGSENVSSDVGTAINVAIHTIPVTSESKSELEKVADQSIMTDTDSNVQLEEIDIPTGGRELMSEEKSRQYAQEMKEDESEDDIEMEERKLSRADTPPYVKEVSEADHSKVIREKIVPSSVAADEKEIKRTKREKVVTYAREVREVEYTKSKVEMSSSPPSAPLTFPEKEYSKLNREKNGTYVRDIMRDETKPYFDTAPLPILPSKHSDDAPPIEYNEPDEDDSKQYGDGSEYGIEYHTENKEHSEEHKDLYGSSSSDNESVGGGTKEAKEASQVEEHEAGNDDEKHENTSSESEEGSAKSSSSSAASDASNSAASDDSDSENSESDSTDDSEPVKKKRMKKKRSKRKNRKASSNSEESESLSEGGGESEETDGSSKKRKKKRKKKKKKKKKRSKQRKHKKGKDKSIVMNESQFTAFLDKVKESLRDEIVKEFQQPPGSETTTASTKSTKKKDRSKRGAGEEGKDAEVVDSLDELEFEMGTHHGFPTGIPLRKDEEELSSTKVLTEKIAAAGEEVFDVFKSDDELDNELDSENWKRDHKKDEKDGGGRNRNAKLKQSGKGKPGKEEKLSKTKVDDPTHVKKESKRIEDKEKERISKDEMKERKRSNIERSKGGEVKKRGRSEDGKDLNKEWGDHPPEKGDADREKYTKRASERQHHHERVSTKQGQPAVDGMAIATQVREEVYKSNDFWSDPAKKRPIDMDEVPFGSEELTGKRKDVNPLIESSGRWEAPFSDINNRLAKIADPKYPHEEHASKKSHRKSIEGEKATEVEKRPAVSKHVEKGTEKGRAKSPEDNKIDKDARSRVDDVSNEKSVTKPGVEEKKNPSKLDHSVHSAEKEASTPRANTERDRTDRTNNAASRANERRNERNDKNSSNNHSRNDNTAKDRNNRRDSNENRRDSVDKHKERKDDERRRDDNRAGGTSKDREGNKNNENDRGNKYNDDTRSKNDRFSNEKNNRNPPSKSGGKKDTYRDKDKSSKKSSEKIFSSASSDSSDSDRERTSRDKSNPHSETFTRPERHYRGSKKK